MRSLQRGLTRSRTLVLEHKEPKRALKNSRHALSYIAPKRLACRRTLLKIISPRPTAKAVPRNPARKGRSLPLLKLFRLPLYLLPLPPPAPHLSPRQCPLPWRSQTQNVRKRRSTGNPPLHIPLPFPSAVIIHEKITGLPPSRRLSLPRPSRQSHLQRCARCHSFQGLQGCSLHAFIPQNEHMS